MATVGAADIVGVAPDYGIRIGAIADLVVLAAPTPQDALLSRAPRRAVLKRGRVVATTELRAQLHRAR